MDACILIEHPIRSVRTLAPPNQEHSWICLQGNHNSLLSTLLTSVVTFPLEGANCCGYHYHYLSCALVALLTYTVWR